MGKYKFCLCIVIASVSILFMTSITYAATYSISGKVFDDKNCNGQRNVGDTAIVGVTITLNPGAITTSTAGDGSYSFSGLAAGTYTVKETDPAGYCSITPNKITVTIKNKNVTNQDFGDSKSTISPPALCCPSAE